MFKDRVVIIVGDDLTLAVACLSLKSVVWMSVN